ADDGAQHRRAQVQRPLPPDPLGHAGAARAARSLARRALREAGARVRPACHRPRPHDLPRLQLLRQAPALHRRRRRRLPPRRQAVQGTRGQARLMGFGALAVLVAITGLSLFYRSCLGVIAPELSRDLDLAPQDLGAANSAFFLALALLQIPVGLAFDRWGP